MGNLEGWYLTPCEFRHNNIWANYQLALTPSYDHFRGVVSLVRLFSGSVKKGDKIKFLQSDRRYEVLEVGIHNPEEVPVDKLYEGQVGCVMLVIHDSIKQLI